MAIVIRVELKNEEDTTAFDIRARHDDCQYMLAFRRSLADGWSDFECECGFQIRLSPKGMAQLQIAAIGYTEQELQVSEYVCGIGGSVIARGGFNDKGE